ncbi:MAG: type II secretion system protein M [Pseudomonadales bacterium]|nr:type II secretion system protein M [Pseudomonadales bacterium]
MMDALRQKFLALEKRDQSMLIVLMVALVAYVLVGLIWLGLLDSKQQLENRVSANQQLIGSMQTTVSQIRQLQGNNPSTANTRSLSQLAQQAAKKAELKMSRFQPKGDEAQVWLDKVPFDRLLVFMSTIEQQYAVTVLSVSMNSANQAGLVNARIKFTK